MGRRRGELLVLVVLVAGLAVVAAVSLQGGSSTSSNTAPSARPAASAFAESYVSYLGGQTSAATIPYASPQVRSVLTAAGGIPAAYRGKVALTKLAFTGVLGAPRASALLTASAGGRTLRAALSLAYTGGRWEVSSLVPPDFDTVFSPPAPAIRVPTAVQLAARAFALAYSDYRTGATSSVPAGQSYILQQITARQDPLAGTAHTGAHARVIQLSALPQGTLTSVDAVTDAAGHRLSFTFIMQLAQGHWQASQFPVSSP